MTSEAGGIKVAEKSLNLDAVFARKGGGASERLVEGGEMNDRACRLARFFLFCRAIIFNCKNICIFAGLKLYIIRNAEK